MDINVNVNGTITLTADKLLLAALSGSKATGIETPQTAAPALLPQTPAEQAVRQQVVPAPTYTPPPVAQQPQYPQYPTLPQQHQPAAPVNPTPAPQKAAPAMPVVAAPIAPTRPNAATLAMPAPPVTAYNAPIATPVNPAPVAPVAAAPTYQIDDLARAAAQLMDAGKQQECLALLGQFGAKTLGQIPPEQFGAFATALRQMGAKI